MADFFKVTPDETKVEPTTLAPEPAAIEPEKIKVGEKEYSQDDLNKIVGLGETASELESKWNTKIDSLYPNFTRVTQENAELRRQQEEVDRAQVAEKAATGQQLSPDELKAQVIAEADKMGLVHQGNVKQAVMDVLAARDLYTQTQNVVSKATAEGKPQINEGDLLGYMEETGIKDPNIAYDIKFKNELATLDQGKVDSLKGEGLVTESSSTAGSKIPMPVSINRDNLQEAILSVLQRES